MKKNLLILITCTFFLACGSDNGPAAGGKPEEIVGGNEFTASVLRINLSNSQPLSQGDARTLIQANFTRINKVEVGMRWKEVAQRILKSGDSQKYCYEKSESEFEIIEILPAGSATSTNKAAIKLREVGKSTALEGDGCTEEIGKEVAFGPYEYEREDDSVDTTVDSIMAEFSQLENPRAGMLEGRIAYSASITFEGVTYNFIDFVDQPNVVGTYVLHYQTRHAGKVFQNVSQTIPLN